MAKKKTNGQKKGSGTEAKTDCHGRKVYILPGTNTVVHELPSGDKLHECESPEAAEAKVNECLATSVIQY